MFSFRHTFFLGLLLVSAGGCAISPSEPYVVHEVYGPYPYVYPHTHLYINHHLHYGSSYRRYGDVHRHRHALPHIIKRGHRSGAPTRGDAHRGKGEKRDIGRQHRRFDSDGKLSRRDGPTMRRHLDRSPRHSRSETRNGDRRAR